MPLYESVAKLPITEQAAEIDRRCREEYERRKPLKMPMASPHIQMICGISRPIYQQWLAGNVQARFGGNNPVGNFSGEDNFRKDEEERAAIAARREVLQMWESICTATLIDCSTGSDSKSGVTGANFALERIMGYHRESQGDAALLNTGLEALLSRLKLREATGRGKTAEITADVALISIPPAGDTDAMGDDTTDIDDTV